MEPFNLTPRDRFILSLSDDQFQPHSWTDLQAIIGTTISMPVCP